MLIHRMDIAGWLCGELRVVAARDNVLRLHGSEPETLRFARAVAYQQSFDATAAHFAQCLRTGEPVLTDARDNVETMRLVEAAYAAAAHRRT